MQSLLLKLQAEVEARKQPRQVSLSYLWIAAFSLLLFAVAFEYGARATDTTGGLLVRMEMKERLRAQTAQIEEMKGEMDLQRLYIERLERVQRHSAVYGISADLAAAIEDIALSERVDPNVAFNLVYVESRFTQRAISPKGALGYTQLMPTTAAALSPGITRDEIFDRDNNLRLGFRYLRYLIDRYDGNVRLALLAYNRGPGTVDRLLREGADPGNGYARMVLERR